MPELEPDLGDVLREANIDTSAGPGILFVTARLGELLAIAMFPPRIKGRPLENFVSLAVKGAYQRGGDDADFWKICHRSDFEPYLKGGFELWVFDWGSLPQNENQNLNEIEGNIDWELPIVQKWLNNQEVSNKEVERVASFIGHHYPFEEVAFNLG